MSGIGPTFVLSLDKELVWGSFDLMSAEEFAKRNPNPRGIVRSLLRLLDEREIPATWAVVGHLFLDACERGADGRAHPELARPSYRWYPHDWLGADPCTDRSRDPLWYGDDILELILESPTKHEIGCHSFSHIVFGDPGCSPEVAASDLDACLDAASQRGIKLKSFVFPRNAEGYHPLLRERGFIAYRGEDPTWFRGYPRLAKRAAHLVDQGLAVAPPVSVPSETLPGLWNLPGSMLLLPRNGVRRAIPLAARVQKAKRGLERAVAGGGIFHLWLHPFNLASDPDGLMGALATTLDEACRLRSEGKLDIRTMGDLADALSRPEAVRS